MEARSFIPDLVEFLSKRHAVAVALIGSRAEGLSHPVSYDFLCLHAEGFNLQGEPPSELQAPWDKPPALKPGTDNIECFPAQGRPVTVQHLVEEDLGQKRIDSLLEGTYRRSEDPLNPPTATLRNLQKMHILEDKDLNLQGLKKKVVDYPGPLRRAVLRESMGILERLPSVLDGRRECGDAPFISVLLRDAALALVEGLFALNREYYSGPRRMLRLVEGFELAPPKVVPDLHRLFSGADRAAELKEKLPLLERQGEVFVRLAETEIVGIREITDEGEGESGPVIA